MTKSKHHPQVDYSVDIKASSLVEKDLIVSWDTIGSEYDWYRVESICTPVNCELMGVDSDRCPSMTVVSTVVAQNLEELCTSLAFPKLNAPMSAKVLSVQRYSRSYLKQNNSPDQCNVLEDVEFCQIPECQDFCVEISSSFTAPEIWLDHSMVDQEPNRGFWNKGAFPIAKKKFPIVPDHPSVQKEEPEFVSALDGESFLFEGSGSIGLSGFSYTISPFWSFNGSGTVQAGGSLFISFEYEAQGFASLSGSASDLTIGIDLDTSGSVVVSGSSCCVSPSYNLVASGGLHISGSSEEPLLDMGIFEVQFEASAAAFDMGYEYMESAESSPLSISDFTVSACGCQSIGPIMLLRHNLLRSEFFHRFVSSENISFPDQIPMRYREQDNSWTFYQYMSGRQGTLAISSSFACLSDSWRLDFGADSGLKRTRIVIDIPFDIVCSGVLRPLPMLFYFSSFSSEIGSGERIPAVNPIRKKSLTVYGRMDSFVDGIFVPETVYYDELGMFSDPYWSYAPFELRINPPSRSGTKTIDLTWVI